MTRAQLRSRLVALGVESRDGLVDMLDILIVLAEVVLRRPKQTQSIILPATSCIVPIYILLC